MTRWESIAPAVKISDVQKLKPLSQLYESLREKDLLPVSGLKFAIFVGGFLPNDEALKSLFKSIEIPDFPSLHIMGEFDKIIVPERSEELVNLFKAENSNGQIIRAMHIHKGQHVIPHDKQTIDAVKDFLNKLKV
jgi:predicted esterase